MNIEEFFEEQQLPTWRQKQFNQAFYHDLITSFDELFTWPKDLRNKLTKSVPFSTLKLISLLKEKQTITIKALFAINPPAPAAGKKIETVLMQYADSRRSVCVSSMIGCPVGCRFCATGKLGFAGNLSAQQIVDQVLFFSRLLKEKKEKVTNVVFMGMGEPLLNLEAVWSAIQTLTSPEKLALGKRRITISTSGYLDEFKKLVQKGFRQRIAISLHAPNQQLRAQLMPVAKIYPLNQLLKTMDDYVKLTNKRITYEYILIKDVNDKPEHAQQLVSLFQNRLAHINLIPFNPIKGESLQRSPLKRIYQFAAILKKAKIPHTIRLTRGDKIAAACGQLSGQD